MSAADREPSEAAPPADQPDAGGEACWECGRVAECSDHFIPCAGAVARLCDACREAAVCRNLPDADGRRSC